jgi:hypothetical protein
MAGWSSALFDIYVSRYLFRPEERAGLSVQDRAACALKRHAILIQPLVDRLPRVRVQRSIVM